MKIIEKFLLTCGINRQAVFSKKFEYRAKRNLTANGNRETYWKTIWFIVIIIETA